MSTNHRPMFKMLFRHQTYTLDEVLQAAKKNPDILWVLYEVNPRNQDGGWDNMGTLSGSAITEKYG